MNWAPYLLSLGVGVGVGVIYGLVSLRSPAPPIIALLGLLGMLAGEAAVHWLKGHAQPIAHALHLKSFEVGQQKPPSDTTKSET
ncbi:DUF1427 family protein [Roseovarius aestuariivivens]|uniref:DUF1427 family protein n=1 Tax=Roseovarius aestuariivivens TaxID=1888910 RepID=UPI001080221F|nr:DUF1427 family protein [Roseovarius aestuariivivens]